MYATPELAAEYSALAAAYSQLWSPVIRPMALPMFDLLPLAQARHVLDVGTGTGELSEDLRRHALHAHIVGVDRSEGMLRLAQGRGVRALAVMDAQRLAFADTAFDLAVCVFVLFHLPDPLAGLRELRRVLRPAAHLGAVTWGDDPGPPGRAIWRETLDAAGAAPDPRDPSIMQHSRMDTEAKVRALLHETGFSELRTQAKRVEHRFTVDSLLGVQVRCGSPSRRLASLAPDAQARCCAQVEQRVRRFTPEQLVYRPEVIYAVARR